MEECIKGKHFQDSYIARIKPIDSGIPNNHIREHCLANLSQIKRIGRDRCQQVRIERPTATGTALALYTVIEVDDEEPDIVIVDKNPDDLLARLELSSTDLSSADHFPGKVNAQVTAVGITDAEAETSSEFIENLADNGHNHGLIVFPPTVEISKNILMNKQNMLAKSFHLSMFLSGFAKDLRKAAAPLPVGTLRRLILAKNHSRSLRRLCGVILNILLPSMDGGMNLFALEEQCRSM
jgi:hypothetical protein